jgi:hypothetical protein
VRDDRVQVPERRRDTRDGVCDVAQAGVLPFALAVGGQVEERDAEAPRDQRPRDGEQLVTATGPAVHQQDGRAVALFVGVPALGPQGEATHAAAVHLDRPRVGEQQPRVHLGGAWVGLRRPGEDVHQQAAGLEGGHAPTHRDGLDQQGVLQAGALLRPNVRAFIGA